MSRLDTIIGTRGEYRVVPPIVCNDGFQISVQASNGHHCHDATGTNDHYWNRAKGVPPYRSVECGYPSERPEPWHCTAWHEGFDRHEDHPTCDGWEAYSDDPDSETGGIFAYVPVQMVRDLIALHGGERP